MSDYYPKFNKEDIKKNPKLIFQMSPDNFNKFSSKLKEGDFGLLKKVFFSPENINILQKQIILDVFEKSEKNILIPEQDYKQLEIAMKYAYYTYGNNLPTEIKEQVDELNKITTYEVSKDILTLTKQHLKYIDEISNPRELLDLPVNVKKRRNNY